MKEIKTNKQNQLKLKKNKEFEVLESVWFSEKQIPSMNDFKSKGRLNSEIINELKQNGEEEQKADRRKIFCSAYANICGFTKYKTILGFG